MDNRPDIPAIEERLKKITPDFLRKYRMLAAEIGQSSMMIDPMDGHRRTLFKEMNTMLEAALIDCHALLKYVKKEAPTEAPQ